MRLNTFLTILAEVLDLEDFDISQHIDSILALQFALYKPSKQNRHAKVDFNKFLLYFHFVQPIRAPLSVNHQQTHSNICTHLYTVLHMSCRTHTYNHTHISHISHRHISHRHISHVLTQVTHTHITHRKHNITPLDTYRTQMPHTHMNHSTTFNMIGKREILLSDIDSFGIRFTTSLAKCERTNLLNSCIGSITII